MKSIVEKLGITPGPWYRSFWNNIDGIWVEDERSDIRHGDSENICDCIYSEADGKLFFKAPEMLEALIEWALQWEKQFEPSRLFEETVSIIEKATGKSWEEIKELYELHD